MKKTKKEKIIKLIEETQKANKKLVGKSKYRDLSKYKIKKLILNHKGLVELYRIEREIYGRHNFLSWVLIGAEKSLLKNLNKLLRLRKK